VIYSAQVEPRYYNKILHGEIPAQMSGTAKLENGEFLGTFTFIMKP
jgi:hypothetical protein